MVGVISLKKQAVYLLKKDGRQAIAGINTDSFYLFLTVDFKRKTATPFIFHKAGFASRLRFCFASCRVFCLKAVSCADAAYYQFPSEKYLSGLIADVPSDFLFTFKVTDHITIKRYANLPRFGPKAGQVNADYLRADLFINAFLKPLEMYKANVGCLIFEFSRFYKSDYEHGRDFVADLDRFLEQLPKGWCYGVEIRNEKCLHPDYFAVLRKHGVAHCFNSWSGMPQLNEQMVMEGAETSDEFVVSRMLLRPGRSYEEAVKQFSPYRDTQDLYEESREAARTMMKKAKERAKKAFIYVNNRLEGNALKTIKAVTG